MASSVDQVFRDYNTAGVPASGDFKPKKSEIRALLKQIQNSGGQAVTRNTLTALNAVTPPNENYMGVVLNDPDPTKNGYYYRSAGLWVKGRGFPDTIAALSGIGNTGTTITGVTEAGVSPADVLVVLVPASPFTNADDDVSLAINGGNSVPVRSSTGGDLAPGDLVEGVSTMLFWIEDEWRQLFSSAAGSMFDHQGDYDNGQTYTDGQVVTGSNGNWYQLKVASATGDDPVGSVTGNWLQVLASGAVADGSVTFVKMAASAIASQAEAQNIATPVSNKLMTPLRSYQQAVILSDFVDVRALEGVAAPYDSAVDCTAAIQAFITANPNGPHIRFPRTAAGTGFKVSQLVLPAGAIVSGEGNEQSSIWHFGNTSLFDIRGSFVTIRDLRIDAANTTSGASEFKLRTDLAGIERVRIENISTYYSRLVLWDGWSYLSAGNFAVAVELMNIKARHHQGPGFDMRDCWAYLRLRDIVVDYIGGASKNFSAYSLLNNAGSVWENCDVTGGTVDGTLTSNNAFVFQKSQAVWMSKCFADTVDNHGFYFIGECNSFYMDSCGSSLVGNFPVAIGATGGGCTNINLNSFQSFGRKGLGYAPTAKPGIYAIGAQEIHVTGGTSKAHTGDGLLLENCNHSLITGLKSRLNTGRGARTIGTGGALLITGGEYSDNTAGVFAFTGAAHHAKDVMTSSGALGSLSGIGTL